MTKVMDCMMISEGITVSSCVDDTPFASHLKNYLRILPTLLKQTSGDGRTQNEFRAMTRHPKIFGSPKFC
jgi:hypothetical protein